MIPTLFFYELVLVALVWLFLMLYWLGPHDSTARCKPVLLPMPPPRKRSRAPTAFAGLTHKPHSVACEQDATHPIPPLPTPPKSMPSTHRRPRIVDTSMHFCPHAGCDYRGWLGLGTEA